MSTANVLFASSNTFDAGSLLMFNALHPLLGVPTPTADAATELRRPRLRQPVHLPYYASIRPLSKQAFFSFAASRSQTRSIRGSSQQPLQKLRHAAAPAAAATPAARVVEPAPAFAVGLFPLPL
jgi:hypothetical protein